MAQEIDRAWIIQDKKVVEIVTVSDHNGTRFYPAGPPNRPQPPIEPPAEWELFATRRQAEDDLARRGE